jgi:urease accessory protein
VRLGFVRADGTTRLSTLRQEGAARARFPRPPEARDIPEVVLLNTAGGLTGGDRMNVDVALGRECEAAVTSAAAEKIYRSLGDATDITINLALGEAARCHWLPQPTILFDGSNLDRRTHVDMASSAKLLAVEMVIFGRAAMGEDVRRDALHDAWRVKRDGRLIFADTARASGAVADTLDRAATLDGMRAMAMLLCVAPDDAARLDETRALLEGAASTAGASTWNGLLMVRAAAQDGRTLQRDLLPVLTALSGRPLPRVWQC